MTLKHSWECAWCGVKREVKTPLGPKRGLLLHMRHCAAKARCLARRPVRMSRAEAIARREMGEVL